MKGLVFYGDKDIRFTDIEDVYPQKDEIKLKVQSCGICGSDVHGYLGITGRRIPPMCGILV